MKKKLSYLGPEQTYSHEVAYKNFRHKFDLYWVKSIDQVVEEVSSGKANLGIIPFWNSYEDHIKQGQTQELIISAKNIFVSDVLVHNIRLNLLSNFPLTKIKNLYSAQAVLNQCKKFLEKHIPRAKFIAVSSTAEGARIASQQEFAAAIGSVAAGREARLHIIKKNIHSPQNRTLFFVIQKDPPRLQDYNTPYVLFLIKVDFKDITRVVDLLRKHKLRLSLNWERRKEHGYQFIEVQCFQAALDIHSFIRDARDEFGYVRFLGMYEVSVWIFKQDISKLA